MNTSHAIAELYVSVTNLLSRAANRSPLLFAPFVPRFLCNLDRKKALAEVRDVCVCTCNGLCYHRESVWLQQRGSCDWAFELSGCISVTKKKKTIACFCNKSSSQEICVLYVMQVTGSSCSCLFMDEMSMFVDQEKGKCWRLAFLTLSLSPASS